MYERCLTTRTSTSCGNEHLQPATASRSARSSTSEGEITYSNLHTTAPERGNSIIPFGGNIIPFITGVIQYKFPRPRTAGIATTQPQRERHLRKTTKNEKRNFDSQVEATSLVGTKLNGADPIVVVFREIAAHVLIDVDW